jgi:hypothetical protein
MKVDGKELYRIAENANDMVDKTVSEYLEIREDKKKGGEEIDF